MSKNFEEQDGNEKHDEIAGAQSGNDCAQTGEVCSSESKRCPKLKNRKQSRRGKTGAPRQLRQKRKRAHSDHCRRAARKLTKSRKSASKWKRFR